MPAATPPNYHEVLAHLAAKQLTPSPAWLSNLLAAQRPTTPLAALQKTAVFRLLASDITTSLCATPTGTGTGTGTSTGAGQTPSVFPPDIHNAEIAPRRLKGPIAVQVLDVEDVGKSRWAQVEAIEALERGEGTRGRKIVRIVDEADGGPPPPENGSRPGNGAAAAVAAAAAGAGPHKLLLQDCAGVRVYAFELGPVPGVGVAMNIGTKMLLRDVEVARGLVLLKPASVVLLGGKIEALHVQWRDGRKEALMRAVQSERSDGD
ncbi:MAG: hypothetical protein M1819_000559 [Sarea resinae]|nr:MAG: hypothetical protein M1819_000559 [Sarea resinae]